MHLAAEGFDGFQLRVGGLVERSLELSLDDLRRLPASTQTTKHVCIQGWSQIVTWTGVPLNELLELCKPLPAARFLLFHTFDDKWEHERDHGYYYSIVDLNLAHHPQSILAYDMNDEPLHVAFGAPLRLRLESQLGYKMVKFVRAIELVADYRAIGEGKGGWREDVLNYSQIAPI
jgi:methionine sulfoxide reductase catalytic subunit